MNDQSDLCDACDQSDDNRGVATTLAFGLTLVRCGTAVTAWHPLALSAMRAAASSSDEQGGGEAAPEIEWWSIPEIAQALGVRDRDVRSMLSDRSLVAVRRDGRAPVIPAAFVVTDASSGERAVVPGLRGTVIQLADSGYSDDEIVAWLLRVSDELGSSPLAALIELRTHAVRRAAQALAF